MVIKQLHAFDNGWKAVDTVILEAGDDPRQLSLVDAETLKTARGMDGLCTGKFDANLLTEGLSYRTLKVGDTFMAGDVVFEITQKSKRCYDHCSLRQQGTCCPLPANTAFAKVVKGGTVSSGSELILKEEL